MAKYDDDQNIREIESRIDIVELISETVQLSRKGNNYWGLCPFHQEKTASFSVSRDKQMYYCFGCHAGGNIFSFLMKKDGLDFKEALEVLAAKAGVEIKPSQNRNVIDKRKQIIAVNNAAAQYYHSLLISDRGREAQAYLGKRGISKETIDTFQLGYAPDEWSQLQDYLLKKGFAPEILKTAGLIRRSENQNRFYDLFRHRVIFPIVQNKRDVVGFGGRSLGDGLPKYLNTAETDLFSKRKNLYGLSEARESIREKNSVILVEGYMDCIKLQQNGFKNVVASLGTALTEEQARLMRRYTEKVVVIYDGDEAGQRETLRAINVLKGAEVKVEVISLPPGKDPDEYIEYYGKEGFWQYITNNGYSDIEFKLNRYISAAAVLNLDAKINIINLLKQDISSLPSALEKDHYVRLLSRKLRVEENLVSQEIQKNYNYQPGRQDRNNIEIIWDNYRYGNYGIQEKILAAMLKSDTVFTRIKNKIGINFFANPNYRTLITKYDELQGDHTIRMKEMIHIASREGLESDYARIAMLIGEHNPDEAREIEEFIMRVEQKKAEYEWEKAFTQLKILDDSGNFDSVLEYILNLDKLSEAAREGGIL